MVNKLRLDQQLSELVNIGSCSLHNLHGAFRIGAERLHWDIKLFLYGNLAEKEFMPMSKKTFSKKLLIKFLHHTKLIFQWSHFVPGFTQIITWYNFSHYEIQCCFFKKNISDMYLESKENLFSPKSRRTIPKQTYISQTWKHLKETTLTW